MAYYKKVESYALQYQNGPRVWVEVEGDNRSYIVTESPNDALFVADMLRNEKPVHYNPDNNVLSTSAEEVGQEESD